MYSVIMILVISLFQVLPRFAPGVLGYASNINISDLLSGTNEIRAQNGLSTLTTSPALEEAARQKAAHMFERDYWSHVAPDGTAPWDFILGQNYDYTYAGENLAKNFTNSDQVVDGWYQSPSHRDNLLNGNYEEIGFAVVNGVLQGYETTLVVQMFGKPRVPTAIAVVPEAPVVDVKESTPVAVVVDVPVVSEIVVTDTQVLPAVDVTVASKTITFLIGGFLLLLLVLDIWYSKRKAIPKITATWSIVTANTLSGTTYGS